MLQGLRTAADNDSLIRIKEILGEHTKSNFSVGTIDTNLDRQKDLLKDVTTGSPKWKKIHLTDLLEKEQAFTNWCKGTRSSLLVLSGHNGSKVHSQNSWLSPVIIETIQMLINDERTVAYHFCRSNGTTLATLSSLTCSLLERDLTILRRCKILPTLTETFSRGQKDDDNEDAKLNGLKKALIAIIEASSGPVHIVLDRPELLGEGEDVESIMETALEVVRGVGKEKLKVMVCVDTGRWKVEPWAKRRGVEEDEVWGHVRRDQTPR